MRADQKLFYRHAGIWTHADGMGCLRSRKPDGKYQSYESCGVWNRASDLVSGVSCSVSDCNICHLQYPLYKRQKEDPAVLQPVEVGKPSVRE